MPKAVHQDTPDALTAELDDDDGGGQGALSVPRFRHWLDAIDALGQTRLTVSGAESLLRRLAMTPPTDGGMRLLADRLGQLGTDILKVGEIDIAEGCRAHEANWSGMGEWVEWFGQIRTAAEVADGIARLLRQVGQTTNDAGLRLLGDEMAGVRLALDVVARRLNVTCIPGARVPA